MSTNYYMLMEKNKCSCCGRADTRKIHIGMKAGGWRFSFQGFKGGRYDHGAHEHGWGDEPCPVDLTTWQQWRQFLRAECWNGWSVSIVDEYGQTIPLSILDEIVYTDYAEGQVHNEYCRKHPIWSTEYLNTPDKYWDDPEGFSFSIVEFS